MTGVLGKRAEITYIIEDNTRVEVMWNFEISHIKLETDWTGFYVAVLVVTMQTGKSVSRNGVNGITAQISVTINVECLNRVIDHRTS